MGELVFNDIMARMKFGFGKIAGLSVLVMGLAVGIALTQKDQDFREKAGSCPMTPQCPASDGILKYCLGGTPTFTSQTPTPRSGSNVNPVTYGYIYAESKCDIAGKRSNCGGQTFCCPSVGGVWTTDLLKCAVPMPVTTGKPAPVQNRQPVGTPVRGY